MWRTVVQNIPFRHAPASANGSLQPPQQQQLNQGKWVAVNRVLQLRQRIQETLLDLTKHPIGSESSFSRDLDDFLGVAFQRPLCRSWRSVWSCYSQSPGDLSGQSPCQYRTVSDSVVLRIPTHLVSTTVNRTLAPPPTPSTGFVLVFAIADSARETSITSDRQFVRNMRGCAVP